MLLLARVCDKEFNNETNWERKIVMHNVTIRSLLISLEAFLLKSKYGEEHVEDMLFVHEVMRKAVPWYRLLKRDYHAQMAYQLNLSIANIDRSLAEAKNEEAK